MSETHEKIEPGLADWIQQQHVFFVATAPLSARGHVNTSPKGGEAFRILGPMEVAYQDYTGSGAETAAHLRENGRIVLMFCAMVGPPRVLRLHGLGKVVRPGEEGYGDLAARFPPNPGTRAYVHVRVERVSTSCGYSVPFHDFVKHRESLDRWAAQQGPDKLELYRAQKNQISIDGLPSLTEAHAPAAHWLLHYEKGPGWAERQKPFQASHVAYVEAGMDRGLVLAGSFEEVGDGSALLLFRTEDRNTVAAFAQADPFVTEGIVCRWTVRKWDVALGTGVPRSW